MKRPDTVNFKLDPLDVGSEGEFDEEIGHQACDNPIRVYLREIGQTRLLTKAQERGLVKKLTEAREAAARMVLAMSEPVRAKCIVRKSLKGVPFDGPENGWEWRIEFFRETVRRVEDYGKTCQLSESDSARLVKLRELSNKTTLLRNQLVTASLRLVVSIARQYHYSGLSFLDLIQEGNIGLMRAADLFDYTRGFKFSTFATWWIRQSIRRARANTSRVIRLPVHMVDAVQKVRAAKSRLVRENNGKVPLSEEIAAATNLTAKQVEKAQAYDTRVLSLGTELPFAGASKNGHANLEWVTPDELAVSPEALGLASSVLLELRREFLEMLKALASKKVFNRSGQADIRRNLEMFVRFFCMDGGLAHSKFPTLGEVGKLHGVSREWARQVMQRAFLAGSIRDFFRVDLAQRPVGDLNSDEKFFTASMREKVTRVVTISEACGLKFSWITKKDLDEICTAATSSDE